MEKIRSIPQIAENLTRSGNIVIPETCPVCGQKTHIREENETKTLYCINEECPAKKIKQFTHFVSRDAMNIEVFRLLKKCRHGIRNHFPDALNLHQFLPGREEQEGEGTWRTYSYGGGIP